MKVGVAIYYSNIQRYPERWVKKCLDSVYNQTYKDYHIYKLDYGQKLSDTDFVDKHRLIADWKPLPTGADAMNYINEWIFQTCDVSATVHIDDYYHPLRFELLLEEIQKGADIASSNYYHIDPYDNIIYKSRFRRGRSIISYLRAGYNPVSCPCHIMHKRVFDSGLRFNPSARPADMDFWIRSIEAGFKISIRKEYLHYYRRHPLQGSNLIIT